MTSGEDEPFFAENTSIFVTMPWATSNGGWVTVSDNGRLTPRTEQKALPTESVLAHGSSREPQQPLISEVWVSGGP